jgi:inner membrane protein
MDPVTHSLVGATLSATSLGQKTRLAAPALIVGANLPDLDIFSYFVGGDFAIGFRRGWTHGALALVALPALLAGLLWIWSQIRRSREDSPPLRAGWMVVICYLAVWTHPALDWLNTYGMRWLMPFSGTWFYGDSVFIVDPWLWLILGCSWLVIRRRSWVSSLVWLLPAAFLLYALRRSGPQFVPLLSGVFLVALVAHLWPPPGEVRKRQRIAATGLLAGASYIGLLLSIHSATVDRVLAELEQRDLQPTAEVMVGPTPTNPLVWDVVFGIEDQYRYGQFSWISGKALTLSETELPAARPSSLWTEIEASGQLEGYLSWIRFPWYDVETRDGERLVHIMDARYRRTRTEGFGGATVRLPGLGAAD